MPTFIFNKLVRDKLRDEYMRMNEKAEYRKLSRLEFSQELAHKIVEEVNEIPHEGTKAEITAELADAKQAMDDLMNLHDIKIEEVTEIQKKKFDKKGGFSEGNFVVSLELKDDDEWVEYYRKEPNIFIEVSEKGIVEDVPLLDAGIYEHYKGKRYEVVGVGLDSETSKPVVVYVPLYESDIPFFVRPYEMFLEFVEVDGTKVKRFERVYD